MSVDYTSIKNQGERKRKKIFLIFALSVFLAVFSFGSGIVVAELKLRKAKAVNHSDSAMSASQRGEQKNPDASSELKQEAQNDKPQMRQEDKNNDEENGNNADKFSFAVIGDTQRFDNGNVNGGVQKAMSVMKKQNIDLMFALGDLVSSCDGGGGCESKLNSWKNILGPLFSKTYATMGNHDRTGKEKADSLWQKFFNLPVNGPSGFSELVYSFDLNNSHFVVLDSEKPKEHIINKIQRDWLENDLAANKKDNTFVFFHEPAYPVSSKIDESLDVNSGDRDALWSIFTRYKVTAVFSGHEHINSRRKVAGVYQFGFGNTDSFNHDMPENGVAEYAYQGRNFGIVEVAGEEITVKVYSVEGNLLNTFSFSK